MAKGDVISRLTVNWTRLMRRKRRQTLRLDHSGPELAGLAEVVEAGRAVVERRLRRNKAYIEKSSTRLVRKEKQPVHTSYLVLSTKRYKM